MIPYPTAVPVDEIKSVISTIQSGTILTNRVAFVKDIWLIEGYCLEQAIGDVPAGVVASSPYDFRVDNPEILGHLQSMCVEGGRQQALPPATWIAIAKWALQTILTFLN